MISRNECDGEKLQIRLFPDEWLPFRPIESRFGGLPAAIRFRTHDYGSELSWASLVSLISAWLTLPSPDTSLRKVAPVTRPRPEFILT